MLFIARDWASGNITGEIPFSKFSYTETLCRAGSFSGEMDPYDPRAALLVPHSTFVYALDDSNVIRFAGMLGALDWTGQSEGVDTLTASGYSLWGYWNRRLQSQGYVWNNVEQMAMAKTILDDMQSLYPVPSASIYMTTELHPPAGSGVPRIRSYYASDGNVVNEIVEALADCLNGFEFRVLAKWSQSAGAQAQILHVCELWYPRLGQDLPYIWRDGTAIRVTEYSDDFSAYASQATGFGSVAGDGGTPPYTTVAISVLGEPLYEVAVNAPDVSDEPTLEDKCAQAIQTSEQYLVKVDLVDQINFPYGVWQIGDTIRLVADRGSLKLDGNIFWRITGMTVDVDDIGSITTSIVLTDSGRRGKPTLPPAQRIAARRKQQGYAIAMLQRHA
jgi:hypothetical protein